MAKNQFVPHREHNAIRLERGLVLFVLRNKETHIHRVPIAFSDKPGGAYTNCCVLEG